MDKICREKMLISSLWYLLCPEIWKERSYCSNNAQEFCSNFSSAQFDKQHFLVIRAAIAQFVKTGNQT